MTTQQQVRDMHAAHPRWSAARIAAALGCSSAYVRATGSRLRLSFSKGRRDGIEALGRACQDAGITLRDIAEFKKR